MSTHFKLNFALKFLLIHSLHSVNGVGQSVFTWKNESGEI